MSGSSIVKNVNEALKLVSVGEHSMVYGVPVVRWSEDLWEVCSFGDVPIGTTEAVSSVLTFCAINHGMKEQRRRFKQRYG
jgi:hypothetical protein